jgi:hypothetical protein
MGGEIKMSGSLNKKQQQLCKVEELVGSNAPDIEGEINNKLKEGWVYQNTIVKGNKIYLVFIK